MKRFLLVPFGSAGDVHPFLGLARVLQARGHSVQLLLNPYFDAAARAAGLEYVPIGHPDDYMRAARDPRLWDPQRALSAVAEQLSLWAEPMYHAIARSGEVELVASGLALAARLARETLGLPLTTVHLQPVCLRSEAQFPLYFPFLSRLQWLPRWAKRLFYRLIDAHLDPQLRAINDFYVRHGHRRVRSFLGHWWHSPDRVIALFPEWYAPNPGDWPAQTRLTSFPLYDPDEEQPLPDLSARPVVITPGSANLQAERFLRVGVEAVRRLGMQPLVLTRFPEQVPPGAPHCAYLPLGSVLPHCSALLHHGGIGTLAQGLAAGCPQLVMPMAHDQPDNLFRLRQLGAGDGLPPRQFTVDNVCARLERLLRRHTDYSSRLRAGEGLEQAADLLN